MEETAKQFTEAVAAAAGIPVVYDGLVYRHATTCERVDPAHNDGDAARLAVHAKIHVMPRVGFTVAAPLEALDRHIVEYDQANGGDRMKSYRLAVCRAVLKQAEGVQS